MADEKDGYEPTIEEFRDAMNSVFDGWICTFARKTIEIRASCGRGEDAQNFKWEISSIGKMYAVICRAKNAACPSEKMRHFVKEVTHHG